MIKFLNTNKKNARLLYYLFIFLATSTLFTNTIEAASVPTQEDYKVSLKGALFSPYNSEKLDKVMLCVEFSGIDSKELTELVNSTDRKGCSPLKYATFRPCYGDPMTDKIIKERNSYIRYLLSLGAENLGQEIITKLSPFDQSNARRCLSTVLYALDPSTAVEQTKRLLNNARKQGLSWGKIGEESAILERVRLRPNQKKEVTHLLIKDMIQRAPQKAFKDGNTILHVAVRLNDPELLITYCKEMNPANRE